MLILLLSCPSRLVNLTSNALAFEVRAPSSGRIVGYSYKAISGELGTISDGPLAWRVARQIEALSAGLSPHDLMPNRAS